MSAFCKDQVSRVICPNPRKINGTMWPLQIFSKGRKDAIFSHSVFFPFSSGRNLCAKRILHTLLFVPVRPFNSQIKFVILLTVNHTILITLVQGSLYWVDLLYFSLFSSLIWLTLY